VTLEGTLTTLAPGYLVIEAAERIAGDWARASLAPASLEELARKELGGLALLLRPRHSPATPRCSSSSAISACSAPPCSSCG
jgi:hypothetical protein